MVDSNSDRIVTYSKKLGIRKKVRMQKMLPKPHVNLVRDMPSHYDFRFMHTVGACHTGLTALSSSSE